MRKLGCVLYSLNSKISVLLLAAGDGARWRNFMNVPKFMVPIDGVPLVENTIARLRKLGVQSVELLVRRDDLTAVMQNAVAIDPNPTNSDADKFLSSRDLWNADGQTVLAFADVYYSECALNEMLICVPNTIRFLGRNRESSFTGCDHGEIFAVSFTSENHNELDQVLRTFGTGQSRPSGWQLYRKLLATAALPGKPNVSFVHIDDFTEDFDLPRDYKNWLARWQDKANAFVAKRRVKEHRNLIFGAILGTVMTLIGVIIVNVLY